MPYRQECVNKLTPPSPSRHSVPHPKPTKIVSSCWGEMLSTRNLAAGTLLEILQKLLDSTGRPRDTDHTEGRFMALCEGYLDPAVYSKGRQATLAGRVLGTRTDTVGEITYVYPLLACLEVHLWPPLSDYRISYPYDYGWPWYSGWPWYGSYLWRPYPFRRFQ